MRYLLLILCLMSTHVFAESISNEKLVIVTNKNFPLSKLNYEQVKQIFLKRTRYINNIELLPINITTRKEYRIQFEKKFLHMNAFQLKRYWTKAHYHGLRPPKMLASTKSIIAFIRNVNGAIAYIPLSSLPSDLHVLLKVDK